MGKNFWTEYRYTAPDGRITHIIERGFSVHGPAPGAAQIMDGAYEQYDVSEQDLKEIKQTLEAKVRPWYASDDTWVLIATQPIMDDVARARQRTEREGTIILSIVILCPVIAMLLLFIDTVWLARLGIAFVAVLMVWGFCKLLNTVLSPHP